MNKYLGHIILEQNETVQYNKKGNKKSDFFLVSPSLLILIFFFLNGILGFFPVPDLLAQEDRLTPEEMHQMIQPVLVPSPGELFVAADALGEFDWNLVVNSNTRSNYPDFNLRYLNLGVRIGNCFLALQAKDTKRLGECVSTLIALARVCGIDEVLLARGTEVQELAVNKKWNEVNAHLNVIRYELEVYIVDRGDEDDAVLVSVGGWIEGLRALTELLYNQQYDKKASIVIAQPALAQYLYDSLTELSDRYQRHPVVHSIIIKLPEIINLMSKEPGSGYTPDEIYKLYTLATELVFSIVKG